MSQLPVSVRVSGDLGPRRAAVRGVDGRRFIVALHQEPRLLCSGAISVGMPVAVPV
jgi:hypothetical protein